MSKKNFENIRAHLLKSDNLNNTSKGMIFNPKQLILMLVKDDSYNKPELEHTKEVITLLKDYEYSTCDNKFELDRQFINDLFFRSSANEDIEVLQHILNFYEIDEQKKYSALRFSVWCNNVKMVKLILDDLPKSSISKAYESMKYSFSSNNGKEYPLDIIEFIMNNVDDDMNDDMDDDLKLQVLKYATSCYNHKVTKIILDSLSDDDIDTTLVYLFNIISNNIKNVDQHSTERDEIIKLYCSKYLLSFEDVYNRAKELDGITDSEIIKLKNILKNIETKEETHPSDPEQIIENKNVQLDYYPDSLQETENSISVLGASYNPDDHLSE